MAEQRYSTEYVTVSSEYLAALEDDAILLLRLRDAGVENWPGYKDASKDFYE